MRKPEHGQTAKRRLMVLFPLAVLTLATVLSVEFAGAQQSPQKGPPPATPAQSATLKSAALAFAQANGDTNWRVCGLRGVGCFSPELPRSTTAAWRPGGEPRPSGLSHPPFLVSPGDGQNASNRT
jgi:hypothetical protein